MAESSTKRTKTAHAESAFYYQVKAGGERGWNDIYIHPEDQNVGSSRFFLRYYDLYIASLELIEHDGEEQTKITVYGTPQKAPVPLPREVNTDEWTQRFDEVMEAIQNLFQLGSEEASA